MNSEPILTIRVSLEPSFKVRGSREQIVMIPFTGTVDGDLFRGKTVGTGVDTQKIGADGSFLLSARYMLEGTDAAGNACRIFIENQGNEKDGFVPRVVTDSPLLQSWAEADLYSTLEGAPGGVTVRIWKK